MFASHSNYFNDNRVESSRPILVVGGNMIHTWIKSIWSLSVVIPFFVHLFFLIVLERFYLFSFRETRREEEREGEKQWCVRDTWISPLLHTPNWGPGPQPRHMPWLGVKPLTFHFAGWCSIPWATPARACHLCFTIPQGPWSHINDIKLEQLRIV